MKITENEDGGFNVEGITQEDLKDIVGVLQYGCTEGSNKLLKEFDTLFDTEVADDLLDKYYPAMDFVEAVKLAGGTEGITICPTIKRLEK